MSLVQTISLPQGENKTSLPLIADKPGIWKTIAGALWKFLEEFGRHRAERLMNQAKKYGYYC